MAQTLFMPPLKAVELMGPDIRYPPDFLISDLVAVFERYLYVTNFRTSIYKRHEMRSIFTCCLVFPCCYVCVIGSDRDGNYVMHRNYLLQFRFHISVCVSL